MSTTILEPGAGTPFDQLTRALGHQHDAPAPASRPVVVVAPVPMPRAGNRAPLRSTQQRKAALDLANDVRLARAQHKRDIRSGIVSATATLLNPPSFMLKARVWDVLMAMPGYGRWRADKILSTCWVSHSKTIGGLTERQRTELVEVLERR